MLYDRWRQVAREFPREPALYDVTSGRRWTFAQLDAEAGRGGSDFGLPAGTPDRDPPPALRFPQGNSADFIFGVLRAWRVNQVVCPLEPGQPLPHPSSGNPLAPEGGGQIVHLKTTSATAGPPRLVAFTAGQLAADAENLVATMGLRRDWPNLGVISLAHSYGFSNLVTPLLLHGIPLILAAAPLPETVRRAAGLAASLALPAVPAMWRAWHEADAIPPNVKLAISAGAPLPLALEQRVFAGRGLKIHNFYGTSECGGIAYDASETPRADAACVGSPMRNVSLSVADDGCLEVRSHAVAEMYLENGELRTSDSERPTALGGGCFHTGDLAQISAGQVFLRGRVGDQINVAGRKVSPETIERALLRHPEVLECLVLGVPSRDADRTEDIVAVVVSGGARHSALAATGHAVAARGTDAPCPTGDILRQFVLETLPAWQTPRHWWFVDTLQTNVRGKVSRAEWRGRFMRRSA